MRRYCSCWTAAEATLAVAWGVLAVVLMAYALARGSVGSGGLAAFAAWQMSHVWNLVHARAPLTPRNERAADSSADRG
jgi:heme O synthase-like polyprenyltransferase